jgi:hypothetical protein
MNQILVLISAYLLPCFFQTVRKITSPLNSGEFLVRELFTRCCCGCDKDGHNNRGRQNAIELGFGQVLYKGEVRSIFLPS